MRVLVCGGRNYSDATVLKGVLDGLQRTYGRLTIIQGGATGADAIARDWAYEQPSAHLINEAANWSAHGRAAGPIRNQRMIDEHKPDLVVAAPGGRGTSDMVRRAKAAGIKIYRIGAQH